MPSDPIYTRPAREWPIPPTEKTAGEAGALPGARSTKGLYSRVRKCPGFRVAFEDACSERDFMLMVQGEEVIEQVSATGIRAANAALRALEARRGRLRPKLYRPTDRGS